MSEEKVTISTRVFVGVSTPVRKLIKSFNKYGKTNRTLDSMDFDPGIKHQLFLAGAFPEKPFITRLRYGADFGYIKGDPWVAFLLL
ncbi:MAG: hypothetical protein PHZ26_04800 [Candidatus Gracilibacteria bacterium]|nr:hypothetical protein [Candidatus Gracilibacteria bacterium]MDD2909047.1 hypothetical protein [Candidatus Gracilibacteria bacterium]